MIVILGSPSTYPPSPRIVVVEYDEYSTHLHVPVSVFSDFYVSDDEAAVSYNSTPHLFAERAEHRGIGTLELSKLWGVLRQGRKEGQNKKCGKAAHIPPMGLGCVGYGHGMAIGWVGMAIGWP